MTFPTRTRRFYQQNFANDAANPVRAGDSWTNRVDVTGDDQRICVNGNLECNDGPEPRIDGDGPDSRTVVDTSSASQTSGGISIDKTVLNPAGVPTPVSCSAAQTANPNAYVDAPAVPTYGVGDRICWRLRVDFSSTVDTGEPEIRDFLPAGLVYETGSAQPTSRNTIGGLTVDDSAAVSDRVLAWALTDVDTANQVFEWTFATTATAGAVPVNAEQSVTGNLMKLAYRNTGGETFSLRDRVEAEIVKPVVGLVKDVTAVSPVGTATISGGNATNVGVGATVNYRVRLSNRGDSPAVRTVVWDNLPAGVTCADVVALSISNGGTCAQIPLTTNSRITWSPGVTVPVDGTTDLTYQVVVPQGQRPAATLTNTAGVVEYARDTNSGGSQPFVPASNIDPTRTTTNAPRADDPASVTLRDVTLAKSVITTSVNEAGNNAASQATIGETIDYRVRLTVPAGTTLFGTPTLTDAVNARMELLTSPAPGVSQSGGSAASPAPVTGASANTLTASFGGPYVNSGTTDAVFDLTFRVRVRDVTTPANANRRGQTLPNSASLAWRLNSGDIANTTKVATAPNVTIVEPNLTTTKVASPVASPLIEPTSTVSAGDGVRYTIEVRNQSAASVAPSHQTLAVDTVPVGITPRKTDGTPVTATGDQVGVSGFPVGTWNAGSRTITWSTIGTLAPADFTFLIYDADVDTPAPAGAVYTNSVTATGTSLNGTDANERTPDSTYSTGYTSTSTWPLTVQGGTLTKTAVSPRATVGDLIDYTVEYTLPANVVFYDLLFNDYLPDGVEYVPGSVQSACLPDCAFTGTAAAPNAIAMPGRSIVSGQAQHGFFLDDIAAAPEARTIRLTYQGRITQDYFLAVSGAVEAGDVLTNNVQVLYNATNKQTAPLTGFPNLVTYDQRSTQVPASVIVTEPRITLNKHVSGIPVGNDIDRRTTVPGDDYTYTLTVTNTGTSPAYDVDVTDTPSAKLTNVVATAAGVSPAGSATVVDGDGDDGSLAWTIPGPLAPGASVTLTYTADLVASSELSANETVVNTATVPSYWNASEAERTADPDDGFREYTTNPPTDTVTLDVRLPNVTVQKTTGVSNGAGGFLESAPAEIGESLPWRVVITNPSPSSTAKDVKVSDVLPAGWSYDEDSAAFAPAPSVTDFDSEPEITALATGDALTWANVGDIAPGGQVVLTFTATPTLGSKPRPNPQRNLAAVAAADESGATESADGPYADDDTADATLRLPTLTVAKTPDGANATAGTTANYSVVIRNTSTNAPARDVVVTDVLQAHQTYTAGTATASPATGFSEVAPVVDEGDEDDADDDTTTIGWRIASIPAGGSVTITVPVRIADHLAADTVVRNGVSVVSREITDPVTDDGSLTTTVSTDVGVEKTISAPTGNLVPGQSVTYEIETTNHGPSVATDVKVEDEIPDTLTLVSAPGCAVIRQVLTCDVGTLEVGASETFTVTATINADATGTLSNTATVSSTSPDGNATNNTSTASRSLSPAADLDVTKTVSDADVHQGDEFTYEVKVRNDGPSDAVNVTLEDELPDGVVLADTAPATTNGTCTPTAATNTVNCALGTLEPGETATVTITARAVDVGTFNNVATAATTTSESDLTNNEDDVDVTVAPVADVGIEKTALETVAANSDLTYTLKVSNNGPSPATNVVVEDELPDGVSFVSASEGCEHAEGVVRCALASLPVTTEDDPAVELTITVHVPWTSADASLSNTAKVAAEELDRNPDNDDSTAVTEVGPAANLKTTKSAPALPVPQSVPFEYQVTVENQGPSTAVDATLLDEMPTGITALEASSDVGTCRVEDAPNRVECDFGDLAKDASATVTITARGDLPGTTTNTATASSETPEVDEDDNEDTADVTILAASDVGVVKSAPTQVDGNAELTYRLTTTNHGPSDATGVTVTDQLPPGVEFRSADAGCALVERTVTCVIGDLATGDTVAHEIVVFVPNELGGQTLTNVASVTVNEVDLNPDNDSSQVETTVGDVADLAITKTAVAAVAGGQASWILTVVNNGPTAAEAVVVRDDLPVGTAFHAAQPSVGSCRGGGREVLCDLGTLAPGASAQITVAADVAANAGEQTLRNVATVASPTPDPDKGNNVATADVVVSPAPPTSPDLRVTKTASTTQPMLGQPLTYRIQVTNVGGVTATDARMTDTMNRAARITRITPQQGECTIDGSSASCRLGAIAPGQTVTVDVRVTPESPGDLRNTVSVQAAGQGEQRVLDNTAVAGVRVNVRRSAATIRKTASKREVRGGERVTFTITAKMGKHAGSDVRICDRLPRGLTFVRATGARFSRGQACWTVPFMRANQTKRFRIVARTERSDETRTVRNRAVLSGRNVSRRSASATVRVTPALAARPGGVTG
ncbi:MAG: hypothetical protein WC558_07770 [Patulibacter sp.]